MEQARTLMPIDRSILMDIGLPPVSDEMRAALDIEERFVPRAYGPDVRVVIYRPRDVAGPLPVLLDYHGGGFCLLHPEDFAYNDASIAIAHQALVIAVDYRLAPEDPFPAGFDDCYAVLEWTMASAASLDVDLDRLVVTGASAGGALAAAVCLKARDTGGPRIAAQVLTIPVIDDRLTTPSMNQFERNPGFSGRAAQGMWLHYLGVDRDVATTSPYAAPGRATRFDDLPPAVIITHGRDPLRDEGIQYALQLMAAGVPVELHNVPGAYHGAPPLDPKAMARGQHVLSEALGQALRPD